MKTLNDIIKLMTKVMETLPRYLDLSEKSFRSDKEELELEELLRKLEIFKEDISDLIPNYNSYLFNDFIEEYYDLKRKAERGDSDAIEKYSDLKPVFLAPLREWLNHSLN